MMVFTYRIPKHLDDNISTHECHPRIRFRRPFAGFVHGALIDKNRHDLLHHLTEDEEEDVDAEHLIPEAAFGIIAAKERQPNEQGLSASVSLFDSHGVLDPTQYKIALTEPNVKMDLEKIYEGLRQYCWKTRLVTSCICTPKPAANSAYVDTS